MSVKQVSVFIENSPGKLASFTRLIADNGIDLAALTIADTSSFGILRCLVADPDETVRVVSAAGHSARVTDVIAAVVPDKPGGLAQVLAYLADAGISLEYCYSFARGVGGGAALALRVDDLAKAESVLAAKGVTLIDQRQVAALNS